MLVRCFTEPIGLLYLDIPADGLSVPALSAAVEEQLGDRIRLKLHQAGVEVEGAVASRRRRLPLRPPLPRGPQPGPPCRSGDHRRHLHPRPTRETPQGTAQPREPGVPRAPGSGGGQRAGRHGDP